jgi:type IV secretory pathway protease TraF
VRRRRIPARWLVIGAGGLVAAVAIGLSLVPNLGANQSAAAPAALNRIARANDAAAAEGAARLRDRARFSVELRDAQERGRDRAEADLRRADAANGNTL